MSSIVCIFASTSKCKIVLLMVEVHSLARQDYPQDLMQYKDIHICILLLINDVLFVWVFFYVISGYDLANRRINRVAYKHVKFLQNIFKTAIYL